MQQPVQEKGDGIDIIVKVNNSSIPDIPLRILITDTTDMIKDQINSSTEVAPDSYALICRGKPMDNLVSMKAYDLSEGIIHLVMLTPLAGGAGKRKTLTGMIDYTPLIDDHNRVLQVLQYRAPGYEAFIASLSPSQFAGWVAHVMKQKNFERIIEFTANEMLLKKQFQDMIQLTLTITN